MVIVAVVPDADADTTVGHSNIDLVYSVVAAGSPAVKNADVAHASPLPDFGQNYCCNLPNYVVDQHHVPNGDFAAATDWVDMYQVEDNDLLLLHCCAAADVHVEHQFATAAAAVVAAESFFLVAAAPHSSFSFRSSFSSYSSVYSASSA